MSNPDSEFTPGERLDRFCLEKLLGAGAFGEVWLAMEEADHGFRRRVALKILAKDQSARRVEALLREARICGAMNHPNVVGVSGVMKTQRCSFIIMDYVDGETLSAMWRDLEHLDLRFPRAIIVDIGVAVAEALYHGWQAVDADGQALKIVHRDLKPANIMVSDRGVVKVADFGIAKVAPDQNVTRTGKLKGTPSYMAPELWSGTREFRPAIDLWSLGVILWELCTGRRFFGRATISQIFDIVTTRRPEDEVQAVRPYFPAMEPILLRLLHRAPEHRYQDALELARDLRAVRQTLGPAGDLLQFNRLLRAGRLEPTERDGSLAVLPALPPDADDWVALLAVASGEELPSAPWEEDADAHVVIGPDKDAPSSRASTESSVVDPGGATAALDRGVPSPSGASGSGPLAPPPESTGVSPGQTDTVPIKVPRAPAAPVSTRVVAEALAAPPPRPPLWRHPLLWLVLFGALAVALLAFFGLGAVPE